MPIFKYVGIGYDIIITGPSTISLGMTLYDLICPYLWAGHTGYKNVVWCSTNGHGWALGLQHIFKWSIFSKIKIYKTASIIKINTFFSYYWDNKLLHTKLRFWAKLNDDLEMYSENSYLLIKMENTFFWNLFKNQSLIIKNNV